MLRYGSRCHRKGQGMLKAVIILGMFGGFSMFAQVPTTEMNSEYAARWFGPVVTSITNVVACLFAYLTVRDSKKYDAEKLTLKLQLDEKTNDHEQCEQNNAALRKELDDFKAEQRRQFDDLWKEMHGEDRRKGQQPGKPKRRATDKGTGETPVLPAEPPKSPDTES